MVLDSQLSRAYQVALKRNPNGDWWGRVIFRLHDLPFVKGTNDRGWKITLSVMVRDAEKFLDGKYGGGLGEGKAVPRLKAAPKEADPFCAACKGTGVVENVSSGSTCTLKCAPRPPPQTPLPSPHMGVRGEGLGEGIRGEISLKLIRSGGA